LKEGIKFEKSTRDIPAKATLKKSMGKQQPKGASLWKIMKAA
jgi:hypothetical protein